MNSQKIEDKFVVMEEEQMEEWLCAAMNWTEEDYFDFVHGSKQVLLTKYTDQFSLTNEEVEFLIKSKKFNDWFVFNIYRSNLMFNQKLKYEIGETLVSLFFHPTIGEKKRILNEYCFTTVYTIYLQGFEDFADFDKMAFMSDYYNALEITQKKQAHQTSLWNRIYRYFNTYFL